MSLLQGQERSCQYQEPFRTYRVENLSPNPSRIIDNGSQEDAILKMRKGTEGKSGLSSLFNGVVLEHYSVMQSDHNEIEQILAEFECWEDFKCHRLGFGDVCKAVDVKTRVPLLLCLEQKSHECEFLYLSATSICTCPVRAHLARKLNE